MAKFKGRLQARQLAVRGITTDGSPLYPKPLAELWPDARHQVCEFHVLKEILKAVLHAVAKLRKELPAAIPKQPRGRPNQRGGRQARRRARFKQRLADLFAHRHLFVQQRLTAAERALLTRLTRGLPQLGRLREIMDEVYRLFDRRCRTATALGRLEKLRRRVRRLKRLGRALDKLKSANLEKALVFLDDPPAALDKQRGGAREPPLPQDSEERLQPADEAALGAADRSGHGARTTGEGPEKNPENLASGTLRERIMALLVLQSQKTFSIQQVTLGASAHVR